MKILYLTLCFVYGFVLSKIGFGLLTWQYWVLNLLTFGIALTLTLSD